MQSLNNDYDLLNKSSPPLTPLYSPKIDWIGITITISLEDKQSY